MATGFPKHCLGQSDRSTWKVRGVNAPWSELWTLTSERQDLGNHQQIGLPPFLPYGLFQDVALHTALWQTFYVIKQPVVYFCEAMPALEHATLQLFFLPHFPFSFNCAVLELHLPIKLQHANFASSFGFQGAKLIHRVTKWMKKQKKWHYVN